MTRRDLFQSSFVPIRDGLLIQIERPAEDYRAYFKIGTGSWDAAGAVVFRLNLRDFSRDIQGLSEEEKTNAHADTAVNSRSWLSIVSYVVNERLKDHDVVDFAQFYDTTKTTHFRDRELLRLFHEQMVVFFKSE